MSPPIMVTFLAVTEEPFPSTCTTLLVPRARQGFPISVGAVPEEVRTDAMKSTKRCTLFLACMSP